MIAKERTILITGAGRGVGAAMGRHLAVPGTRLLLHYRSGRQGAEGVAAHAWERGAEAQPLQADLATAEGRAALWAQVEAATDQLQVLINNAAIYDGRKLEEFTPADWQTIVDVNCTAVFDLTQRAAPLLRRGAPGRVINIGDSASDRIIARGVATPYHVAKLGVSVLTRSYAKLLAPDGVTVNQISPGFLEGSAGERGSAIPAGREGTHADLLGALDYLLSPDAAYVTGANLTISGGWNL